jgi:iron complex outermembrane receptor protein
MTNRRLALWATSAIVGALLMSGTAWAQSTGTQTVEEVVVTAKQQVTVDGAIKKEDIAKSRGTITQDYIKTQPPGQSVLQSINLLPGVSFTNNDPFGSSGGDLRLRSFDGNRISLTFDGIPLNDTGNYAIFSNQLLDPELITQAAVNLGTTDTDSPTASATGGTVNYLVRRPADHTDAMLQPSYGSFDYKRLFGLVDTGPVGPWGTTMWFAASDQRYEKFKGPGIEEKKQFNARAYQTLGDNGDFISVALHYNQNRNNFYRNLTLAQINKYGQNYDELPTCTRGTENPSTHVTDDGSSPDGTHGGQYLSSSDNPANPSSCTNYYNLRVNPSDTGNIRVQSRFTLRDNLHLTVDPSFQYVLANGGGTTVLGEGSALAVGGATTFPTCPAGQKGIDFNGDGDCKDFIRFYTPNNTNTHRYGVISSLIWDVNDNNRIRVAYTFDHGRHRQTGEWTPIDAFGNPLSLFGGRDGAGPKVNDADGFFLRQRDRLSIAELSQFAIDYNGKFLDNRLRVTAGVRDPFFTRELNQHCYTGQSGFATCTSATPSAPDANGFVTLPTLAGNITDSGNPRFVPPFKATLHFTKVLPNAGITFNPWGDANQFYVSYAEGYSAPRTDDLYAYGIPNVNHGIPPVRPETTKAYDLGYRYNGNRFLVSTALWDIDYQNRIVSSFDDTCGCFIDRNIGAVKIWGWDGQAGWKVTDAFSLLGSASYDHSALQGNLNLGTASIPGTGGPFIVDKILPTKGKALVETPDWTFAGRAQYQANGWRLGLQAKYVGRRFSTDLNDQSTKPFTLVDADVNYDLGRFGWQGSWIQLNVSNVFDQKYLGSISSSNTANGFTQAVPEPGNPTGSYTINASNPTYAIGSPRTVWLTLRAMFQ